MIMPMTSASPHAASSGSNSDPSSPATPAVTENMFLQLLVEQLKNQDPSNPSDSTQFVTQLAQFQTMEQSLNQGEDITAMRNDLDKLVAAQTSTATKK